MKRRCPAWHLTCQPAVPHVAHTLALLALRARVGASVASMKDTRGEIREFLTTRRAKITPGPAGLPHSGGGGGWPGCSGTR